MSILDRAKASPNQPFDILKKRSADARRHQDREVFLNLAFYLGEQHAEWINLRDGTGKLVMQAQANAGRPEPRPVINKIMHFINEQLAMAMQTKPVADVRPAGDGPLSQSDAHVANAYIRWLEEPNVANWEATLWNANLWALVANDAYFKWTFDPVLKRPDIQFCPSTDVYSDPYAKDFYKARWVIHSQFLDPEQVYDAYGVELEPGKIEKADADKTALLREIGQAPVEEGVTINELWLLPSRRHPKGLFHVWSGRETLIDRADYPYKHGGGQPQLPFTQIGSIPRPNSKHFAAPVTFMRAPQAELNHYHAQRLLTRKNWAILKLWIPEEVELETPWDNSPDQVLRGSSVNGAVPQIIGPPGPMPDNNDGDWIGSEMGHVVGIRPVTEGQAPGRVEAAKALELLREADTSRLAVLNATTGGAISRGYWQALMLARQFNQEEIAVAAYGPEGVPEVHRFFTSQFKAGMRIRVNSGSGLAFSRAARLDQLTALWNAGILRDPEVFADLADIPMPHILSLKAWDVKLARNENLTLGGGQAITANSWDDHTIHIREHDAHRKTAEFQAYKPETKQRFEHHVSEHRELELVALKRDAEKAALMQQALGAPPPGPAGPGENSGSGQEATFYQGAPVGPGAAQ